MNILILHSWLKDFLKTKAPAKEIGRCLALCGPSVETVSPKNKDFLYDIEITSNRSDTASILGIAREAAAILPRFGHQAKFSPPQINKPRLPQRSLPLKVNITPASICPRFTSVILENVSVKPSPSLIQKRLELSGIRSLNNIVDISNYLMLETGQPIHTFDYDKIAKHQMTLRLSQKGESVITLDNVKRSLPGDDIVIEDGDHRLIDLCGIMGAANSTISPRTKRVLFFVQAYDPVKIRRTSMLLAHRTEAAVRFEKSVDAETIPNVIYQGIKMCQSLAEAKIASKIYDLYPQPYQGKTITASLEFLEKRLGINLAPAEIKKIFTILGFRPVYKQKKFAIAVPSWRQNDLDIPEDLVEEIARIYGYHNLPSNLPSQNQPPQRRKQNFTFEYRLKNFLKHQGLTEIYNYSMVSQKLLDLGGFNKEKTVRIDNPLTKEWVFLRPSLLPSLFQNAQTNQNRFPGLKIFEMANVYQKTVQLPREKMTISALLSQSSFSLIKGLVEAIFEEIGLHQAEFTPCQKANAYLWQLDHTATIKKQTKTIGLVGQINPTTVKKLGLKGPLFAFSLNVSKLKTLATSQKTFVSIPNYPPVIEDLSFVFPTQVPVSAIQKTLTKIDPLIKKVAYLESYHQTHSFRITYQSNSQTLTEQIVKTIRHKILKTVEEKLKGRLKE